MDSLDLEDNRSSHDYLINSSVKSFSWKDVNVLVKDRQTKLDKNILSDASGMVKAGEILAIMGPSGSGKTTLLNVLAHREASSNARVEKQLFLNNNSTSLQEFRNLSSFVEQEDTLIGALTVRETLDFAAKLSLPRLDHFSLQLTQTPWAKSSGRIIGAFGLHGQANTLIGTPIRKGISGGQKRRVSVASQLITSPKVLFLDEPTSGLDSKASLEVISFVRNIAREYKLIVIMSIHQPSTAIFSLFDRLLLLSHGRTLYDGPTSEVRPYFASQGHPMPQYINPAEFIIDLASTDFASDPERAEVTVKALHSAWQTSRNAQTREKTGASGTSSPSATSLKPITHEGSKKANTLAVPFILVHRSFIKGYRDVIAYGIRIGMYLGLAIMMGTVWLRLPTDQENIQNFINATFFGGAFMSFMAVAYIPAYIEYTAIYAKERANGLYGPTAFSIANFIIGIPFLFLISLLFSTITYWLSNFRPTATAFFTWILWLFLDLLCAESLVVLLTNILPIFVVALAAVAFANGLWMSVGGFLVQVNTLNVFWRYVFHYIDYQAYVFQGMMVNEFKERSYRCAEVEGGGCDCLYSSELEGECRIQGQAVLRAYGYDDRTGEWLGIMVGIIAVYRLLGWGVLYLKKR